MKRSLLKKFVMLTLAMGAMYVPSAFAEEAQASEKSALDQVTAIANRMESKLVDTPANVSIVTAEEIERRNYQDALEAIKNVPGVSVLEASGSDNRSITIGGSDRVLVLVNGRRVGSSQGFTSYQLYGRGNFDAGMLPNPAAIERIEVLKGGGATVYGADAVGGVVNIITKKAQENMFKIDVNTGSWGTQNYKGVASVKEGKTGVFVAASKSKQNYMKYKEANTSEHKKWVKSKSDKVAVNLKVEQEIGDDQLLTLFYDHLNKKGDKPGPVTYKAGKNHKIDNNLALRYDWNTDSSNTGYVQIYRNNVDNEYIDGFRLKTKEHMTGIDIQQTIKTADSNTLVVGASYNKTSIDTDYYSKYNKNYNNKSIFVQDSWDFADTWKLNTGLRYDNHSQAGSKTSPSVAVNKKFNENSHAYVSWAQVFNAPNTDEMFSQHYGNSNLKAETGDVWTIGYESKIGRKTQVGASVFYSKLDDVIGYNTIPRTNLDKQKRRGLELNYKYNFDDNWSVNASYAYVKVEDTYGKLGIVEYARDGRIMPNQFKFGVSFNKANWNIDLIGRGASGGSTAKDKTWLGYPYIDSKFLTLDLSINYKIKDNWKIYAKGYNLTNAAYTEHDYWNSTDKYYSYPAPGRHFLIGTEFTF